MLAAVLEVAYIITYPREQVLGLLKLPLSLCAPYENATNNAPDAAVLHDGILDVAYNMHCSRAHVPGLLNATKKSLLLSSWLVKLQLCMSRSKLQSRVPTASQRGHMQVFMYILDCLDYELFLFHYPSHMRSDFVGWLKHVKPWSQGCLRWSQDLASHDIPP